MRVRAQRCRADNVRQTVEVSSSKIFAEFRDDDVGPIAHLAPEHRWSPIVFDDMNLKMSSNQPKRIMKIEFGKGM